MNDNTATSERGPLAQPAAQPRKAQWPSETIPVSKEADQAKARAHLSAASANFQYEYLPCAGCGHRFQRLDWASAMHALYHAAEGYNVPDAPVTMFCEACEGTGSGAIHGLECSHCSACNGTGRVTP